MQAYMTQPRKRLLSYFQNHADETLSAAQISADLPEIRVSAVYRNLSTLEKEGALRKTTRTGTREVFYQYMDAEACRAHLHLSCKACGQTFHMDARQTEALVQSVAAADGFAVDRSETVLYGVCGECQAKAKGK